MYIYRYVRTDLYIHVVNELVMAHCVRVVSHYLRESCCTLQVVAVCCSVLQDTATRCDHPRESSVLQCVAVWCSTL